MHVADLTTRNLGTYGRILRSWNEWRLPSTLKVPPFFVEVVETGLA